MSEKLFQHIIVCLYSSSASDSPYKTSHARTPSWLSCAFLHLYTLAIYTRLPVWYSTTIASVFYCFMAPSYETAPSWANAWWILGLQLMLHIRLSSITTVVSHYVILVHSQLRDVWHDSLLPRASPCSPLLAPDISVGEQLHIYTVAKS